MSGPTRVTAVRLIRPDDLLRRLGVQDRPHESTTVVSTALATGLCTRRPLTFRSPGGFADSWPVHHRPVKQVNLAHRSQLLVNWQLSAQVALR
jgi:hypothetical protein